MINESAGTMMVVDLKNNPYDHHNDSLSRGHNRKQRPKFGDLLKSDYGTFSSGEEDSSVDVCTNINVHHQQRYSSASASTMSSAPTSGEASPCVMSPWVAGRYPLTSPSSRGFEDDVFESIGLVGSIVREEGHIYSLAASGDLLYTGSDSKNIRVWKNLKEYTGFKSSSGLVKAIVIFQDRILTGHQDGKIRVWKVSKRNPKKHKRVGTLPTFKEMVKSSVNPKHYIEARRRRNVVKVKHFDAVSCLSLDKELGLLYSSSWDTTVKVWRISDSKCLESICAHDDAINSVVVGFDDLVFTGSADGTVKMWKREIQGKGTKHFLAQVLLKQENAVTALAVNLTSAVIYSGSSDGLVSYWEHEKRGLSHRRALRGHKSAVLCLATAGKLILSGSADKNVCIWRRNSDRTHVCLSVLTGHMGPVKCLAIDEDRSLHHRSQQGGEGMTTAKAEADEEEKRWIVYSGSLDKSVKVWRVSEGTPA